MTIIFIIIFFFLKYLFDPKLVNKFSLMVVCIYWWWCLLLSKFDLPGYNNNTYISLLLFFIFDIRLRINSKLTKEK
jgi:hypothetical protein